MLATGNEIPGGKKGKHAVGVSMCGNVCRIITRRERGK